MTDIKLVGRWFRSETGFDSISYQCIWGKPLTFSHVRNAVIKSEKKPLLTAHLSINRVKLWHITYVGPVYACDVHKQNAEFKNGKSMLLNSSSTIYFEQYALECSWCVHFVDCLNLPIAKSDTNENLLLQDFDLDDLETEIERRGGSFPHLSYSKMNTK